MNALTNKDSDIFIPDQLDLSAALNRTTHLAIAAHPDDIEMMALHGILQCYDQAGKWFTGVVCADGARSPRSGRYADYTDEQMQRERRLEQRAAAQIGKYSAMLQLAYPSHSIKDSTDQQMTTELCEILRKCRPQIVYTHNPADKHVTHIGVLLAVLAAIRVLPPEERPQAVYGCEVWRDLDWLPDQHKVVLDVSGQDQLSAELLGVFASQLSGGKRYDLATLARRRAHATFLAPHAIDTYSAVTFAIDLTPVCHSDRIDIAVYTANLIKEFQAQVAQQLGPRPKS